jgi:hypothetical protein
LWRSIGPLGHAWGAPPAPLDALVLEAALVELAVEELEVEEPDVEELELPPLPADELLPFG